MEPMHQLDSGMMPPPSTLPLAVRRPSSTGNVLLLEQIITSPLLKAELMEENSQGSLSDATSNHDSMDHMSNSSENSMDSSTAQEIQYMQQRERMRKHSIELMAGMHDSNSMTGFQTHENQLLMQGQMDVMDLRVNHEQMAAAIHHQYVTSNDGSIKTEAQIQLAQQADESVNNFLSNLESSVSSNINAPMQSVNVGMFNGTGTNGTNNSVIFTQNLDNQIIATTRENMKQNYGQLGLMTEASSSSSSTSAALSHMLNFVANNNSNSNSDVLMDSVTTNHSPLSQDVMLNSQPAEALNSVSSMSIMPTSQTTLNMSTECILNPTVSPTMMCQTTDPGQLLVPQTTALSCHQMQPTNPHDNLITNHLILTPASDPIHVPRTSPVAVKNMILNAAAEILSSKPTSICAETTINALITLNSSPLINDIQSTSAVGGGPQMMITQAPSMSVSNAHLMQQQQDHSHLTESMCQQQPMPMFVEPTTLASTQQLMTNAVDNSVSSMMNTIVSQQLQLQSQTDQLRRSQEEYLAGFEAGMQTGTAQ